MTGFAPDERTVVHVLKRAAENTPDKVWIAQDGAGRTYGEMEILSNRLARGMLAQGIERGDTVLFMLADVPDYVATWIACAKAGIVEVPVNTAYRGDILVHVANDARARTIVCDAEYLERLGHVADRLTSLERIFVYSRGAETRAVPQDVGNAFAVAPFEQLCSDDAGAPYRMPEISELKSIMYTSGTTGASKGVMVAHAHAFEYAAGCAESLQIGPDDVYYTAGLPLFHVAGKWGVVYAAAQHGATAAVADRFSAGRFWDDVRGYGATAAFLLGAMANFLQRQPEDRSDRDNPLAKVLMCPLLPDLEEFAQRFDVQIATAYGSTEVNAPVFLPLGAAVDDIQMVGTVRADKFDVRILNDDDREAAPGDVGEIAVRSKEPWITMLGYWNQPEWTLRMWRNQWLHSGDAGRRDGDGNIYFVDRIKDAIRRRGENISSMEVEAIISRHPSVAECAVYPIASEHSEQEVAAAIALKAGQVLNETDLIRWLEPNMPYFMVPRYVRFAPELPKTPTGKIKKYELRAEGVTDGTWDREAAGITIAR